MFNNWFCDRCHFYENEECTNSWGCDSELRSHLALMPKSDVKVTSLDKVNLINQHLVLSPDERS